MPRTGEWEGHYVQDRARYPQRQRMVFADGAVRGAGSDELGPFELEGEYTQDDGRGRVGWIKTYRSGHSVLYLGELDGDAIIGHWSIQGSGDAFELRAARPRLA